MVSKIIGMTAKKLASRGLGLPDSKDLSAQVSRWRSTFLQRSSPQSKNFYFTQPWEIKKNSDDLFQWIQEKNSYSLFFDGSSRGNPWEAGVGGVILDPRGKMIRTFCMGDGTQD